MACGCCCTIGVAVLSICLYYFLYVKPYPEIPPVPHLEETWWGVGVRHQNDEDYDIKPFNINVSEKALKDLRHRLTNALPLQEPLKYAKHHYGINTNFLKTVVDFWQTKYDWREREIYLNQYPQFTVSIQGLKIHYLHVKPRDTKGLKVIRLLLLHGWPGSVREFYELIPFLTTHQKGMAFVFEVIAPSIPGFGFSDAPIWPGLGLVQTALVLKNLMRRLVIARYYVQGSDVGGALASHMATLFPQNIIGMLSSTCFVGEMATSFVPPKGTGDGDYILWERFFYLTDSEYFHIQTREPDTIGVALRDSPVGLAAYMLKKFTAWPDPRWRILDDGGLTEKYNLTDLLDNIMIYWITGSITTSMRVIVENFENKQELEVERIPIEVPSSCLTFKHDVIQLPEMILKTKYKNLIHFFVHDGGYFTAFESPKMLAGEIYVFAQKVEAFNEAKRN